MLAAIISQMSTIFFLQLNNDVYKRFLKEIDIPRDHKDRGVIFPSRG